MHLGEGDSDTLFCVDDSLTVISPNDFNLSSCQDVDYFGDPIAERKNCGKDGNPALERQC